MTSPVPTVSAEGSPWLAETANTHAAALGELTADVVVVGAGITGATTALLLAQAGVDVVVLEAAEVASGVTGLNTAKVSALQGSIYTELTKRHGIETAAAYGAAQLAAVELVAELADAHAPDAGARRRPAATVAGTPEQVADVHAELAAARAAGLPVYGGEVDAPVPCHAAAILNDQLSLHPVRFTRGVLAAAIAAGARVHEYSRVLGVAGVNNHRVRTADATASAQHVVIASHYPSLDRGGYFARLEARRSYCVAGRLPGEAPETMTITPGSPTRSFAAVDGLAILGGEGHAAGDRGVDGERYDRLEADLRSWCALTGDLFRWSAQDAVSFDHLPMIGPYLPGSDSLWVATGYGKWGLTNGALAGRILADLVLGRDNAHAHTFRPSRISPRSTTSLAKLQAKVALDMVGDRLRSGEVGSPEEIAPGTAAVLRRGLKQCGVYRDADGALHGVSLRCTHLGCLVRFNAAETSWDCPCHGSRFDVDGEVLEGPAVKPLAREDV